MDSERHKLLLQRAGDLLARRAYSRGELRGKLAKIAGEMSLNSVLDRLEQLNLLNDYDYAYNFALRRIKQDGWSTDKVLQALIRREVAQSVIDRVLERIRAEIGDESPLKVYVQEYCRKRGFPTDVKNLRSLFLHLRRRGFDEEDILRVLRGTVPPALWQRFETGE